MKSIKDFIKQLQEIEHEYPNAVVAVHGHPDGNGYFGFTGELKVTKLVHNPGYSWRAAGDYFDYDATNKYFEGSPIFDAVVVS